VRARAAARRGALAALSRVRRTRPRGVRIVHYHFVFDDELRPFERQLQWFRSAFEPVSLTEAVRRLKRGDVGGDELVITFDDGFRNQANAASLLDEAGFAACFFVITGLVDMPLARVASFCRDTLHLPRGVEPLGWEEIAALASGGHEIGSHTRTHRELTTLPRDELVVELEESKRELESRLTRPVAHVSAPYGDAARFSRAVSDAARDVGYASCAMAQRGINVRGTDVFALRRDHLVAGWPLRDVRYFLSR
jgi:peptidoglycan/xylan/chitin deacetylase (PgdA/CDA1 family)